MNPSLLLLCACSPVGILSTTDPPLPPMMEVSPIILDFGSLGPEATSVESITVQNTGGTALDIEQVELSGSEGDFWVYDNPGSFGLSQGASAEILAAYSPINAYEQRAEVLIHSSTDGIETAVVELLGIGLVGDVQISPEDIDLGDVFVGCSLETEVEIGNVGTEEVVIIELGISGTALTLASGPDLPAHIAPGDDPVSLTLRYEPSEEGTLDGVLEVTSDTPDNPSLAAVQGTAAYAGTMNEVWEIAPDERPESQFVLSRLPVPDTLEVRVNGVDHGDWIYVDDVNAVVLESDPAEGGDDVQIDYGYLPDSCE